MALYICENKKCGRKFKARPADRARGWARFCSKSCKACEQEGRTGQYRQLRTKPSYPDLLLRAGQTGATADYLEAALNHPFLGIGE